jgi:arylsulfatase A-like enzyme
MISGTLELAAFLLKCHFVDPRNYNTSRHFPWMYPLAGILVAGVPGLLLALGSWLLPTRLTSSTVLRVLLFLTFLGLLFRCPIYTAVCLLLAAALALRTAPMLAARAERFDRVVRRSLVFMTVLLAATALVCCGRPTWAEHRVIGLLPPARRSANSAILIVLDTVRADSLGLYGYHRDTTPNLTRLAARGWRFDRAFATAPWTAPSHASMFTGRWPHELSVGWNRPLDGARPTLAEHLGAQGYATAGFVANTTYCSYETGLDRGFAHYEDYDVTLRAVLLCSALVQRMLNFLDKHPAIVAAIAPGDAESEPAVSQGHRKSAQRINHDFLTWLDRFRQDGRDRPFFAFLNYYDAHHPYLAPESGARPALGRKPSSAADIRLLKTWWDADKRRLGASDIALARDSYDRCIAYLDGQLGRLFAQLERRGVLSDTLVVITADHGEHFGEQQLFGHGCSLYTPELQVPLLIFPPTRGPSDAAHRIVTAPVSLRNLAATIAAATVPTKGGSAPFPGHSLLSTWSGAAEGADGPASPILSELEAPPEADPNQGASPVCRGPLASLVDRGFHYIRNGDGQEELYDLESDPHETRDLARSGELGGTLRRIRDMLPQGYDGPRLSPDTERLAERRKLND